MRELAVTPEIIDLAKKGEWFAFSVSGGKDGNVATIAANRYLDSLGHPKEKRLMIHSDLGLIEWADSGRMCRELESFLKIPLVTVRHNTLDMIGRWQQRFDLACGRYQRMEIVTLIGPWSSPENRFCTSELKAGPISSYLVKMVVGNARIVSVTGIRGEESPKRAKQPVTQEDSNLFRKRAGISGVTWRPIHGWKLEDVKAAHVEAGFRLHEAYTTFGAGRVSCAYCVLANEHDLKASCLNPENGPAYNAIVLLEGKSGFSFQGARWLADVAPQNVPAETRNQTAIGKAIRAERVKLEAQIPKGMLYEKGWPTFVPSLDQCKVLASVRRGVCGLYQMESGYLDAKSVQHRYAELFEESHGRREAEVAGVKYKSVKPSVKGVRKVATVGSEEVPALTDSQTERVQEAVEAARQTVGVEIEAAGGPVNAMDFQAAVEAKAVEIVGYDVIQAYLGDQTLAADDPHEFRPWKAQQEEFVLSL